MNAWRWKLDLPELSGERLPDLASLAATEWSGEFERFMRNRLVMGAFRYGLLSAAGKPAWDRVSGIEAHLERYRADGNLEHLVDVANLALLEFVEGGANRDLKAQDDVCHVQTR